MNKGQVGCLRNKPFTGGIVISITYTGLIHSLLVRLKGTLFYKKYLLLYVFFHTTIHNYSLIGKVAETTEEKTGRVLKRTLQNPANHSLKHRGVYGIKIRIP